MKWRNIFKRLYETLDAFMVEILKSSDILISPCPKHSPTLGRSTPSNTNRLKNSAAPTGFGFMNTRWGRVLKSISTQTLTHLSFPGDVSGLQIGCGDNLWHE